MLKLYTIILGTFISLSAIASTHGGGVMMTNGNVTLGNGGGTMKPRTGQSPEIVFNQGKQNGIVKFAYGKLVDSEWQIQNVEIPEAELFPDASILKALQDSKDISDWAEIK